MQQSIFDRRDDLHPPIEVAGHPVGGPEVQLGVAVVSEIENARVLEKTADDADHSDSITDARNSRPQAADPTDDQVDVHSGLRRIIEMLYDLRIDERIHF